MIIGVDLVPIKTIPNVITFQSDITTDHCKSQLRGYMKTWKADCVLHDGAPNVGLNWVQDAFTQSQLVLQSLKLAVEFLRKDGIFITKVFRSKDYNKLMWLFQQFFGKVEATKPPSSRNVSAEIFVVCREFKAPKKIDPRLLDPKDVFEEMAEGPANNEAKVFNPEKKKRRREGYDEGDYTQFKTIPVLDFIKDEEPINILGTYNQLTIDKTDPQWKEIKTLKTTTKELLECLKDLKVLGKKDFKLILTWRKHSRAKLELDKKDDKELEVEELNEDEKIEKELNDLQEKDRLKRKREKRRKNETRTKEITRVQMDMISPLEIGLDDGDIGKDMLFDLKQAEKTGVLDQLAKGKKSMVLQQSDLPDDIHIDEESKKEADAEFIDSDDENLLDDLEGQLDTMYESYKERVSERDSKYRAKKARGDVNDEEWSGITEKGSDEESDDDEVADAESDSDSDSEDDEVSVKSLITTLQKKHDGPLSSKAAMFFSDSVFDELDETESLEVNKITTSKSKVFSKKQLRNQKLSSNTRAASELNSNSDSDSGFETNKNDVEETDESENEEQDSGPSVDIVSEEAMTLAHQLALGQRTKHDVINDAFNRYTFRDVDGLPDWFLDDENKHSRIIKPITKEAVDAIKTKLRTLNARPIKKVAEAKARKKFKAAQRLAKLKKKSDIINDDHDKSEREKSEEIGKLMKKLTGKKPERQKVTVVVARGGNRGLSGRPKGVKGRYKMVDGTMKKEQRALKRIKGKKKH